MAPRKKGPELKRGPKGPMTGNGMMVSERQENYRQRLRKIDKDALKYLKRKEKEGKLQEGDKEKMFALEKKLGKVSGK